MPDVITGRQVAAQALKDLGCTTVFGLVGDGNLFIVDEFVRTYGGTYIAVANESASVLAASGYATANNTVGVATVTHGPALTNTLTALVEAVRDRVPVVLLAADTDILDKHHPQNYDQIKISAASGAAFEQVRAPGTIAADFASAFRRARVERRPVVLNFPTNFQWAEAELQAVPPSATYESRTIPDDDALDKAIGIIASARKPILLAGRGAASDRARAALQQLAARIGAPLGTTLLAKSLFRSDPFNIGIFGTLSTPQAFDVISESDCVIAFGASLNKFTTAQGSLLKGKAVVQVDIDPARIGVQSAVSAGVVGDVVDVADTVCEWLKSGGVPTAAFRSEKMANQLAEYSPWNYTDCSTDTSVDLRTAMLKLNEAIPPDRLVVTDGGRFIGQSWRFMDVPNPWSFMNPHAFGSIGLGMATAIGAAVENRHRP